MRNAGVGGMSWQEKEERCGALIGGKFGFDWLARRALGGALPVRDCSRDLVGAFPAVGPAAGLAAVL